MNRAKATLILADGIHGSTKPILVEADGQKFVVKLPSAADKCQRLVNELVASVLARRLALPTVEPSIVEIPDTMEAPPSIEPRIAEARAVVAPLLGYGTAVDPAFEEVGGDLSVDQVSNPDVLPGSVVFDTWIFNEDSRQFLGSCVDGSYRLMLFDNDGAFNGRDWILGNCVRCDFKSAKLNGQVRALLRSRDVNQFAPWLARLESEALGLDAAEIERQVPESWLSHLSGRQSCSLHELVRCLDKRRSRVRATIERWPGPA